MALAESEINLNTVWDDFDFIFQILHETVL